MGFTLLILGSVTFAAWGRGYIEILRGEDMDVNTIRLVLRGGVPVFVGVSLLYVVEGPHYDRGFISTSIPVPIRDGDSSYVTSYVSVL